VISVLYVILYFQGYQKFVDSLRVYVRGGTGGRGLAKYNGIGGRGGHVYVVAQERATLKSLRKQYPERRFCATTGSDSRYAGHCPE